MKLKHLLIGTPQGASDDLRKEARFVFNYGATEKSYSSGGLLPIFEVNRPQGYLLAKIEEALAKHGGLDDMHRVNRSAVLSEVARPVQTAHLVHGSEGAPLHQL